MATLVKYNIMPWHLTHCMVPLQSVSETPLTRLDILDSVSSISTAL